MLAARITLLLAAVAAFTAQGALAQTNYSSIAEAATALNLTSLLAAVNATGLTATLSTFQGIVLAPNNAAFEALGANAPSGDALGAVLRYHVLPTATELPTALPASSALPSSEGVNGNVTVQGTQVLGVAPGANILDGPVTAGNATVYIIDKVLLPPSTSETPLKTVNYSTVLAAVQANEGLSKLLELAGNYSDIVALVSNPDVGLTVFAPTNEAFDAFFASIEGGAQPSADVVKSVLLNHVVPTPILSTGIPTAATNVTTASNGTLTAMRSENGTVTVMSSPVTTANVVTADVLAGKSVVHIVDQVLAPVGPSDGPAPPVGSAQYPTIAAALLGAGNFSALAGLVNSTDLTAALANPNLTAIIFAPTDDAFSQLNATNATQDYLRTVLLYHVVPADTPMEMLSATKQILPTLIANATDSITPRITVTPINENEVLLSGIAPGVVVNLNNSVTAGNSRIYPITSVLLPPTVPPLANLTITGLAQSVQSTANLTLLTTLVGADPVVANVTSDPDTAATVFAPTDAAFEATLAQLNATGGPVPQPGSPEARVVLLTHVLARPWTAASLPNGETNVTTMSGQNVTITKNENGVSIKGPGNNESIPVVMADVLAGKSVVHVISGVILPDLTIAIPSPAPAPTFVAPPPAPGGSNVQLQPPPAGGAATAASTSTPLMVLSALLGALMMVTMAAGSRV